MKENAKGGTVGAVICLDDTEDRWQCVVEFTPARGEKHNVSGELSCDDTDYLWRPD
jgi:hypothetical protein